MWHGAYLAWLEEARVEALAEVGLSIQYLQPLRHGDLVDVVSEVLPRRGLKLTWSSRFLSGQELAAEARVDLVLVECHAQVMATAEGGPLFRLRRRWPDDLASAASALARGQG
jgi:acyl-CoA thioester hydrolase